VYLSEKERKDAPVLYEALLRGKEALQSGTSPIAVTRVVKDYIQNKIEGVTEYVEIYTYPALQEIEGMKKDDTVILAIAVKFSNARLIDNIVFSKGE
jgi:Panthothenate synthetase